MTNRRNNKPKRTDNHNPFAWKAALKNKKRKPSGKRVGKSRPEKANNQLNRRIK